MNIGEAHPLNQAGLSPEANIQFLTIEACMITIPISAIFVVIGLLFALLITTICCFGNDKMWKYTIPIGQLIAFLL